MDSLITSAPHSAERSDSFRPVRLAVAGVGGFAQQHHAAIQKMEREGRVRLLATCDPGIDHLTDLSRELDFVSRGVKLESGFEAMLADFGDKLDAVTLPVPIHLHASMHEACVRRGLACYLEKPPTLDPAELDRMIAVDAAAELPTFVGFHHLANPAMHRLKARIVAGEFGRLREIAFLGLAQRPRSYYARNSWAGRITVKSRILLDSPCGNAMSHHLMNLLYLAGTEHERNIAVPAAVESLLLRANCIEGPDTVFASLKLQNGVTGRLALSHACHNACKQREILIFDEATILIDPRRQLSIHPRKGPSQVTPFSIPPMSVAFNLFINGMVNRQPWPPVRLEDCVSFVELNALLYLAANGIHVIDPSHIESGSGTDAVVIRGIDAAAEDFIATGRWPGGDLLGVNLGTGYASRDTLPQLRDSLDALRPSQGKVKSPLHSPASAR